MSKAIRMGLVLCAVVVVVVGVWAVPALIQVNRISKVAEAFRLDYAVHIKVINDPNHNAEMSEILSPTFMKKYNLFMDDYLDQQGYFTPKGTHWVVWSLETKAAAVLMWNKTAPLSAWDIRHIIQRVDAYYGRNDRSVDVLKVVQASMNQ